MENKSDEQPSSKLGETTIFCTEAQNIHLLTSLCIAVVLGETSKNLLNAGEELRASEARAMAYVEGKGVSSRKSATKMAVLLGLIAESYLETIGCPERALERNLKYILETALEGHKRFM